MPKVNSAVIGSRSLSISAFSYIFKKGGAVFVSVAALSEQIKRPNINTYLLAAMVCDLSGIAEKENCHHQSTFCSF